VLLAIFIATGAAILGYFSLAQSIHSNAIIDHNPTPNQVLPTIMYNCITHCYPQQNAFMDGYKMDAIHAISGQLYANNCSKNMHYCSLYQTVMPRVGSSGSPNMLVIDVCKSMI
jgi:hypothetical protein